MATNISIGTRLRHFRERKKLTKAQVAKKAGIGLDELNQIESENIDLTIGQLKRITESIEITFLDLFSLPPTSLACQIRLLPPSSSGVSPSSFDAIPVPLISGEVAGGNARIVEESIIDWLFLPKEEFGRKSGDLIAVRVFGNSMAPDIPDGAIVAVDRNDRAINSESIYALRDAEGGCSVKRVEILDPKHVALVPNNRRESKVEFWKLEAGETIEDRIIGKVVWVGLNLLDAEEAAESSPPYGKKTIGLAQDLPQPKKKKKDKPF